MEDNGTKASEIVRSEFSFKGEGLLYTDGNDDDGDEGNQTFVLENKKESGIFHSSSKEWVWAIMIPRRHSFLCVS